MNGTFPKEGWCILSLFKQGSASYNQEDTSHARCLCISPFWEERLDEWDCSQTRTIHEDASFYKETFQSSFLVAITTPDRRSSSKRVWEFVSSLTNSKNAGISWSKKGCKLFHLSKKLSDQRFGRSVCYHLATVLSFCKLNGIGPTCTMNQCMDGCMPVPTWQKKGHFTTTLVIHIRFDSSPHCLHDHLPRLFSVCGTINASWMARFLKKDDASFHCSNKVLPHITRRTRPTHDVCAFLLFGKNGWMNGTVLKQGRYMMMHHFTRKRFNLLSWWQQQLPTVGVWSCLRKHCRHPSFFVASSMTSTRLFCAKSKPKLYQCFSPHTDESGHACMQATNVN